MACRLVLLPLCLFLFSAAYGTQVPAKKQSPVDELPKEPSPKLFSLHQNDISLAKALAELARQTGNPVEDRRQAKDETAISVDDKNVPFWKGLDVIAKAAD